jgi:hypothetical protein
VVRHREIEAKQLQDGADQALGLAQGEAEHGTQRLSSGAGSPALSASNSERGSWNGEIVGNRKLNRMDTSSQRRRESLAMLRGSKSFGKAAHW